MEIDLIIEKALLSDTLLTQPVSTPQFLLLPMIFLKKKTRDQVFKRTFFVFGSTSACNDKNRCERCQYFEYHLVLGIYKTSVLFPQIYCKVCAISKFSILAFPLFLLSWDQCQSLPTLPICRLLHMGLPSLRTTNDFGDCQFLAKSVR